MQDARNLKPLTSVRFFAAIWVVVYHYWPNLHAGPLPALVAKGYLGVELFFILSGFILCHVYLASLDEGRYNYGSFLWARLARVYPLHLAVLIGVGLLAAAAGLAGMSVDQNILSWSALPANLLMVHAWGLAPVSGWNHPSWSISAEWFAYLSFPLFAVVTLQFKSKPWLAVGTALVFLFGLYAAFERLAGFPLTDATIRWGALRIVPCFAYGCAIYLLWKSDAAGRRSLALAGALFSGAWVGLSAYFGAIDAVIVAGLGALLLCLASLKGLEYDLVGSRPLVYLGEISYSVYMICIPWKLVCANAAARLLHLPDKQLPLAVWLFMLAGVVPLAALSHHLIERPARDYMRRWAEREPARLTSVA